ncbi:MAG TPA: TIGR03667 family PPOX class F420-dependent oxidoreductase [Ktedonobacteraceae bacterium]|jgi:PPOX class probable F420-dependent enzyme|nr:TIGR03667 family PPOX class F420-dependent oxidoreductase [Ktedonobacteraceae bacterium]
MASLLDLTKERDKHIDHHLRKHQIVWLISVRPDGRPHAVAVWFLWDGETFLIFSKPNNQKVRNLQRSANVVLAVDDTHKGEDPVTIEGTATLLAPGEIDATFAAYVEKYKEGIKQIGATPEQMAKEYSQPIRITPTRVIVV